MADHGLSSKDPLESARKPIIIIGSGCTGLAIAQGLKKAGIEAIVFEKNPAVYSPGERDWNMGLHWAIPVLKSLIPDSAVESLQSVQVDPNTPTKAVDVLSFLNGKTSEVMTAMEIPFFHRLRRSKLRALLAKDLDVRWNKKLIDIKFADSPEDGLTAIFEDGEQIEASMIIGADGARSRTRNLLVGPEAASNTRLPYAASFIQTKFNREQALFLRKFHPLYIASAHPDNLFAFFGLQDAPDADEPEDWTFFFYVSWNSSLEDQEKEARTFTNKDRLEQVSTLGKKYCEPWKSAYEWVSEDQPTWYFGLSVWDPSTPEHAWDNKSGRVTLVGDAAHPMTYQRGQGLNHSITDAGVLVNTLVSKSATAGLTPQIQKEAVDVYEAEMKARAGEEVRLSVLNTTMLHDWQKVMSSPVFKGGLSAGSS
ncbi:FAD protein [Coleophoma crateriformis]|uniref:FAD protein n=1 Tax=Coleophoma crateriformis TaxID=565419 RepID=A0A3D8T6Q9_9HELO|nr:FAD protein [Coleophoma crateriformis]